MRNSRNLTEGNVFTTLLDFTLPFLLANMLQALYSAVDMIVVGQFVSTSAVSGVNIGSQIMNFITGLIISLSMGSTVALGRYFGAGDKSNCARAVANSAEFFSVLALILTPLLIKNAQELAVLMHSPKESLRESSVYIAICATGIPAITSFNVLAALMRGVGNSATPMNAVGIAFVVNVLGDIILTRCFGLGVAGIAIATVAAQTVSAVFMFCSLYKNKFPFRTSVKSFIPSMGIIRDVLKTGLPIALQDIFINLSFLAITYIVNQRGLVASAAVGVTERLVHFMFLVPSAFLSSISAITAQNAGAGKDGRAVKSVRYGMIVTFLFGLSMFTLSQIMPKTLAGIFTNDTLVIHAAASYLRTYSFECVIVAYTFCLSGYLSGTGRSVVVFVHNMISVLLVRIPMAYFLSVAFPHSLTPLGLASPLGSAASAFMLFIYFRFISRRRLNVVYE